MIKLVNIEKLRELTKMIYENCSDIRIQQDDLENMLTAIDRLNTKYLKGTLSKETFDSDSKRLKKETLKIIKTVNGNVEKNLKFSEAINREIAAQRVKKG